MIANNYSWSLQEERKRQHFPLNRDLISLCFFSCALVIFIVRLHVSSCDMEAKSRFPEANQRLICPKPRSLNPSQTLINVLAVLPHCEFMSQGPASDPHISSSSSSPSFISQSVILQPLLPSDRSCSSSPSHIPPNTSN